MFWSFEQTRGVGHQEVCISKAHIPCFYYNIQRRSMASTHYRQLIIDWFNAS